MPPNFDLNRHKSSPLTTVCPPALLDTLIGWAGLLDTDAKWYAISHSWDDFFSRTQRADWRREAILGKTLFELFPDDDQRQMFRKLLASMSEGKLEQHTQVVEFGTGAKALHLLLNLRPLWEEGTLIGYMAQGIDTTREHMNRLALLDRDRRMRDLQTVIDEQKQRLETVISRSREREEKFSELQEQVEQQATARTEALAERTLEHSQEVNAMQAEWEQKIAEFAQQNAELRAECERLQTELNAKPQVAAPVVSTNGVLRTITAELAEEYSNLLTGVLGHSTLAAAELGDSHAAVEDVKAIERAARTAAKLTRKLSALSGSSKRGNVELKSCVQSYFKRHKLNVEIIVPEQSCEVRADAATMDVLLDAMMNACPTGVWSIESDETCARLILLTEAPSSAAPNELMIAREVAHAHAGELEVKDNEIVLSLPLTEHAGMPTR